MGKILYYCGFFLFIIGLIMYPYYLFEGKLFIGGDDTRLLYVYPADFLKNWAFYTWNSVSSVSFNNPGFHFIPFLVFWSGIDSIIRNKTVINYLAFSLPLIVGFVFMLFFLSEIIEKKRRAEYFVAALMYAMSPIFFLHQYPIFLTPVWLIGLIPLVLYLGILYVKTKRFVYLVILSGVSILFSFVFYTFAWILGFIIPVLTGLVFFKILRIKLLKNENWRAILVVLFAIGLPQLFWGIPFALSLFSNTEASLSSRVFSQQTTDTFSPTVLSTAIGNIFFPLTNLFHRQIILDYNWSSIGSFVSTYQRILPLLFVFPLTIFIALFLIGKNIQDKIFIKKYMVFFVIFLISLYFFTVNIGFLKYAFLYFGRIPGFVMFRNFYDKFEIGYVFFYSVIFCLSLVLVIKQHPRIGKFLLALSFLSIAVASYPNKELINNEVWRSKGYFKTVELPREYLDFVNDVKKIVPEDEQIIGIPFNNAAYSVILDENSKNAYVGTSPLKILINRNDITGDLSLPAEGVERINKFILDRNYDEIKKVLYEYNINYVMVTKNIPYKFGFNYFVETKKNAAQDKAFINAIAKEKLLESQKGNYELYSTFTKSRIFSENISYRRISPVSYEITLIDKKPENVVLFKETFHPEWKLMKGADYNPFAKEVGKHLPLQPYGNKWEIGDEEIGSKFYLYFQPQSYFLIGLIITVALYTIFIIMLKKYKRNIYK